MQLLMSQQAQIMMLLFTGWLHSALRLAPACQRTSRDTSWGLGTRLTL